MQHSFLPSQGRNVAPVISVDAAHRVSVTETPLPIQGTDVRLALAAVRGLPPTSPGAK